MTKPIDDGGPAFPKPEDESTYAEYGMSLRDWFAGQAMQALMQTHSAQGYPVFFADRSYATADAMLAERKRGAK